MNKAAQTGSTMRHNVNAERGFTFIEILIAMLVLGVAVLAFAGLQVRALETTSVSHVRSQAMTLASDIVERMRVNQDNPLAVAAYLNAANYNGADVPSGAPASWAAPTGCMRFVDVNTNGCSAAQLAQFDINEVEYLAGQFLPRGRLLVAPCVAAAGNCVFLAWNGTDPADCDDNASPNCVLMQVTNL
jgi:type IV pilus assembly protein PilV